MRTQKPLTWFDWAGSFLSDGKAASSQPSASYSGTSVLVLAESEKAARSLGCDAIGVEHLFAAFLKCEASGVSELLRAAGFTLEGLRSEIERKWGVGLPAVEYDRIPYTPRNRRVVERAYTKARTDSRRVEPKDLFLALLDEKEGLVAELLRKMEVNIPLLREAVA